jgi:hypothetical protein
MAELSISRDLEDPMEKIQMLIVSKVAFLRVAAERDPHACMSLSIRFLHLQAEAATCSSIAMTQSQNCFGLEICPIWPSSSEKGHHA